MCNESLDDYNNNVCAIDINIVTEEEDYAMAKWMSIYYNVKEGERIY